MFCVSDFVRHSIARKARISLFRTFRSSDLLVNPSCPTERSQSGTFSIIRICLLEEEKWAVTSISMSYDSLLRAYRRSKAVAASRPKVWSASFVPMSKARKREPIGKAMLIEEHLRSWHCLSIKTVPDLCVATKTRSSRIQD